MIHFIPNKTLITPISHKNPACILDYVLLRLTLRLGAIVVEVLLLLCGSELTNVPSKQIFIAVTAESVGTKEEWEEFINNSM